MILTTNKNEKRSKPDQEGEPEGEGAEFRNHVIGMTATKISAGVSTGLGSHSDEVEEKGDDQFEIADNRNVDEVFAAIKEQGLQPVMNDYVYV